MGNIVLLDDLTINKIAAGEVIERPASVIKEMVENSIDAGATNICVEIRNGGISYIRITDNGKGIAADDMEMAFERHATSKIRQATDLDTVKTMGFRGEALASVAAISKIEMVSKRPESEIGNKIIVEGGKVLEQTETGCTVGTTITVQNLFYNTPVRYKFLKKDYTEAGYIEDAITRLALVNPGIAFKLINSGKTIIQTSGNGDLKTVIYSIYGKDIASSILNVDYTYEDMHVTGVVGKPEIARSNRGNQLFFVNKRFIKDKTLSHAAEQGFKGLLPIGKYGFLVLNLDIDSSKVDVNVHPAKLEVRFQDENNVFKAIYHAIKDTLLKSELVENTTRDKESIEENNYNVEQNKNSFSSLFRKIKGNENLEQENNVIQKIYNEKFERQNVEKNSEVKEEKQLPSDSKAFDVFAQLAKMQEELKQNSNINSNIDNLIEQRQKLEKSMLNSNGSLSYENIETQDNTVNSDAENIIKVEEEEQKYEVLDSYKDVEQTIKLQMQSEELQKLCEEQNTEEYKNDDEEKIVNKIADAIETTENITPADILNQRNIDNIQKDDKQFVSMYEEFFGTSLEKKEKTEEPKKEEVFDAYDVIDDNNVSVFENTKYEKPAYKFIGIAFSTYIILEIDKELYILDQHAAHERILYEKVKKNYYQDEEKDSQLLLLPDIITLTHKEMDIARDNFDIFRKAGFVLEEFGENTIKLSGAPNMCLDLDTKELFLETLDEINTVARTAKQEIEERFIATVACKAAVKANMALTKEEVDSLMEKLLELPNPFTCPHGRPTAIKMTKTDIEKKFARRK